MPLSAVTASRSPPTTRPIMPPAQSEGFVFAPDFPLSFGASSFDPKLLCLPGCSCNPRVPFIHSPWIQLSHGNPNRRKSQSPNTRSKVITVERTTIAPQSPGSEYCVVCFHAFVEQIQFRFEVDILGLCVFDAFGGAPFPS